MAIALISKIKTTNIGNIALTNELVKLFADQVGGENFRVFGRPLGLYRIDLKKMLSTSSPVALIEAWSDEVVKKYQREKESYSVQKPKESQGQLLGVTHRFILKERLKRMARPFLNRLKFYLKYNKVYGGRLRALDAMVRIVYSGAGEVSDNDIFLRQLLELRVAQKLGKATFAINQSLNVKHRNFEQLVSHIYGAMNGIVVRGEVSQQLLVRLGIDQKLISIAPDTAILTNPGPAAGVAQKKIGINFTPYIRIDFNLLDKTIHHYQSLGYDLVFITNEYSGDRAVAEIFQQRYGMPLMKQVKDHIEFAVFLQQFEFIISTRLHANVIALSAGVPVIPIEGHFYKTKEMLSLFKYPIQVIDKNVAGWEERLYERMVTSSPDIPALREYIQSNVDEWREMAKGNVSLFL